MFGTNNTYKPCQAMKERGNVRSMGLGDKCEGEALKGFARQTLARTVRL